MERLIGNDAVRDDPAVCFESAGHVTIDRNFSGRSQNTSRSCRHSRSLRHAQEFRAASTSVELSAKSKIPPNLSLHFGAILCNVGARRFDVGSSREDYMIRNTFRATALSIAAMFIVAAPASAEFKPENPECIAPASPGGGWDFICRTTAKFLFDLGILDSTMQVNNMTGGGGGVAFAHVTKERGEDNNVIVAASVSTTARIAQGIFEGATKDDVHWLATFGAEYGVIAVAKDSPFQTLKEMMDAILADPKSVGIAGGSSVGSYDHIKPMLLAKEAGMEDVRQLKYVAFSGGGEAMTGLLSGAVQAFSGDFSEARGFLESGDIRVLAVLAPERLKHFPDLPTAKEQGYDVNGANWRGLYMPKGASDEAKAFWSDAIKKMTESPEFQKTLDDAAMESFNNFGADMQAFVDQNIADITETSKSIGIIN
ncbi:Bug family tripartite tricarboxylate transporter substrate binding protein [Defluviimonas sp. SAOS-178_SWC]|uniref:Bug family tripartite tricarboxylate transporter substrate binding protein n=1 Tax=Defluviimonas sp. SAOS-178_SWC TaxID=3121287 RepID=UPI0032221452